MCVSMNEIWIEGDDRGLCVGFLAKKYHILNTHKWRSTGLQWQWIGTSSFFLTLSVNHKHTHIHSTKQLSRELLLWFLHNQKKKAGHVLIFFSRGFTLKYMASSSSSFSCLQHQQRREGDRKKIKHLHKQTRIRCVPRRKKLKKKFGIFFSWPIDLLLNLLWLTQKKKHTH